jgi:hypothetical protein
VSEITGLGVRIPVESVSGFDWNHCPDCVEYAGDIRNTFLLSKVYSIEETGTVLCRSKMFAIALQGNFGERQVNVTLSEL